MRMHRLLISLNTLYRPLYWLENTSWCLDGEAKTNDKRQARYVDYFRITARSYHCLFCFEQ